MANGLFIRVLLLMLALTTPSYAGDELPPNGNGSEGAPSFYAGGVAGIGDLLDPANSQAFRSGGGGLYLHNTGWAKLSPEEQKRILRVFQGVPIAIELGFGSGNGNAWGQLYQQHYLVYGIKPTFIAANAFSNNNHPTPEQWQNYSTALREHGVPVSTLILPTFEYQNFRANMATLSANRVSETPVFQSIIETAGGIVLDTPSGYTMSREQAYRDWVVDAIRWTAKHGLKSVVIVSPTPSGIRWAEDTQHYVHYLSSQDAIPSTFVCENYTDTAPPDYPNRVGSERFPYTALGNCQSLRQQILP